MSGAIQTLLTAVLGLVVAVGHHAAQSKSIAKQAEAAGV
jgi:hypothetical protein